MAQIKIYGIKEPLNRIEICIQEAPSSHWGFRGMTGDEILLDYKLEV